jgi:hypothetical protein
MASPIFFAGSTAGDKGPASDNEVDEESDSYPSPVSPVFNTPPNAQEANTPSPSIPDSPISTAAITNNSVAHGYDSSNMDYDTMMMDDGESLGPTVKIHEVSYLIPPIFGRTHSIFGLRRF